MMVKDRLCCPYCGHECDTGGKETLIVCSLCRCLFQVSDATPSPPIDKGYVGNLKWFLIRWNYLFRKIPPVRLMPDKLKLINTAFKKKKIISFADFGGIWNVHGGYTFYILSKYEISKAYLVDTFYTDTALRFAKKYPSCKLIKGDIRELETINKIERVDLIIFFDVLLHQINWKEVLAFCSQKADLIAIYNPQYQTEKSVRLLELGAKEYFDLLPDVTKYKIYKHLFTEKHKEVEQSPAIWQWGITDDDLIKTMNVLGYSVIYHIDGLHWENPKFQSKGFLFKK